LVGRENIELWQGDIVHPETLSGIAEDVDYVYHLAAEGHVSALSEEAYKRFFTVNVEGTKNLMIECGKFNVTIKKFVHFSSTAAMGLIKKKIVDESIVPQPSTPYQKSKLESEKCVLILGKKFGVPIVVLRPCMIYGVNGKGEFYKMCQWMRKGIFPRVGFGKNLTPLVHVRDVIQGAIKASEKGIPGEIYLLASEHSIDLNELRRLVMEAWNVRAPYPYVPAWLMYGVAWCFEIFARMTGKPPIVTRRNIASTVWDREFSIEKAKRELGYKPQVRFRDGILETVRWFRTLT
jgi:nucleoside-diphosphate-sugar epimerase